MPDWPAYATPQEIARLKEIDLVLDAGKAEKRKIFDRCRKRAKAVARAKTRMNHSARKRMGPVKQGEK